MLSRAVEFPPPKKSLHFWNFGKKLRDFLWTFIFYGFNNFSSRNSSALKSTNTFTFWTCLVYIFVSAVFNVWISYDSKLLTWHPFHIHLQIIIVDFHILVSKHKARITIISHFLFFVLKLSIIAYKFNNIFSIYKIIYGFINLIYFIILTYSTNVNCYYIEVQ